MGHVFIPEITEATPPVKDWEPTLTKPAFHMMRS
jgi:hypothetical protein